MAGHFRLIEPIWLKDFNLGEKLSLLSQVLTLIDDLKTVEAEAISPLVQAEGGAAALNIPTSQIERLREIVDRLTEAIGGRSVLCKNPRLSELDKARNLTANYIVRQCLFPNKQPTEARREAARLLFPAFKRFKGIYQLPLAQKTVIIQCLVELARSPQYATAIQTMRLTPEIDELAKLNKTYEELTQRQVKETVSRLAAPTTVELTNEAQDLLADICHEANATAILRPTEATRYFIGQVLQIIKNTREGWKIRDKREYTPRITSSDGPRSAQK